MSPHGTTEAYDNGCRCTACSFTQLHRATNAARANLIAAVTALLPPAPADPDPETDPVSSDGPADTPPPPLIFTEGDQTFGPIGNER